MVVFERQGKNMQPQTENVTLKQTSLVVNAENLKKAIEETITWLKQKQQYDRDLQREIFHRCLVEALHDPSLYKQAR